MRKVSAEKIIRWPEVRSSSNGALINCHAFPYFCSLLASPSHLHPSLLPIFISLPHTLRLLFLRLPPRSSLFFPLFTLLLSWALTG